MNSTPPPPAKVAAQASRAIGAMFFSVFGGLWLALWAHDVFVSPLIAYALIGIATVGILLMVLRVYKFHAPALKAELQSPKRRRQARGFQIVNTVQWVLLSVVAIVLSNMGLALWIIPAAVFIIGAHFLPLAKLFDYPPHYVTGVAMMLLAAAYPLLASNGASSSIGCLGAGLILWSSAAWSIRRTRSQIRH
jgi:hypothetical protein